MQVWGHHVASSLNDSWMSLDLGECLATGKFKWLARKAKGVGGGILTGEVLESGVSHCVAVHSPLMSPQYLEQALSQSSTEVAGG